MTLCTFYILLYTSDCGEATCEELSIFMRLSLLPPALLCCCQYVKGTKLILIAVCVVEFSYLHSNVLICKLQFCSVNVFTVFLYFLPNYSGNHRCQNYFVKTTFFYSVIIHFADAFLKRLPNEEYNKQFINIYFVTL